MARGDSGAIEVTMPGLMPPGGNIYEDLPRLRFEGQNLEPEVWDQVRRLAIACASILQGDSPVLELIEAWNGDGARA
jgi:hypothetical protein